MATTLAAQATKKLVIVIDQGIVRVDDGFDQWLCRLVAWRAALEQLEAKPGVDGEEGDVLAYRELCGAVASPVASVHGTSRGEHELLARDAVRAQLVLNPKLYGLVIHILRHGFSLCDRSERDGFPRDWPKGHFWTTVDQHEALAEANCPDCLDVYRTNRDALIKS